MMRNILRKYRKERKHDMDMTGTEYEIKRYLDKLDQVAIEYEARWGADNLQNLVSQGLKDKWVFQVQKLNGAIQASNLSLVAELVDGTIRGYAVLEQEALYRGHKPHDNTQVMEYQHKDSGQRYRICRTLAEARVNTEKNVLVYTLDEVVNILEANQLVNVIKETFPHSQVVSAKPMGEDDIPF